MDMINSGFGIKVWKVKCWKKCWTRQDCKTCVLKAKVFILWESIPAQTLTASMDAGRWLTKLLMALRYAPSCEDGALERQTCRHDSCIYATYILYIHTRIYIFYFGTVRTLQGHFKKHNNQGFFFAMESHIWPMNVWILSGAPICTNE